MELSNEELIIICNLLHTCSTSGTDNMRPIIKLEDKVLAAMKNRKEGTHAKSN